MRRASRKLEPTVPASVIRARYRWLKKTLVGFVSVCVIYWLLGFFMQPDHLIIIIALPFLGSYILFCHAFGKIANCFGENTFSWTLTALVFSVFGFALGYFAFKDGVLRAHAESL